MRSFFVGWAARLGRLLATRGLGSEDGDAPVVVPKPGCMHFDVTESASMTFAITDTAALSFDMSDTASMTITIEDC